MSPIPPRSGFSKPSASGDLLSLAEQVVCFGFELYSQWWTITGRCLEHEIERLVQGAKASVPPAALLRGISRGYVNWLSEVVALGPSVAEKAAMEFTRFRSRGQAIRNAGAGVGCFTGMGDVFRQDRGREQGA
jgi:hypothetical protein